MTAAIYLIADGRTRPAPPNECTSLLGLSPFLCLYGERETNGGFNDASWDGLVWGRAERQISPQHLISGKNLARAGEGRGAGGGGRVSE